MAPWNGYERLLDPNNSNKSGRIVRFLWGNALLIATVVSISFAILVGVLVSLYTKPDRIALLLVSLPGEVFLNMLKMIIVPLIIFSVMTGIGSLDFKSSLSLLWRTLVYYMSTTFAAVILGISLVVAIAPGVQQAGSGCQPLPSGRELTGECKNLTVADSIADLLRNLFPENIMSAVIFQVHTTCEVRPKPLPCECRNSSVSFENTTCRGREEELVFSVESSMSPNILGIIVFSSVLAVILSSMGPEGRRIIQVISVLNEAILKLVRLIMIYSPIGIFFLVVGELMKIDALQETFAQLGLYMCTVIVGLIVHSCIVLPVVYVVLARRNPFKLVYGTLEAMLTAASTSSRSVTGCDVLGGLCLSSVLLLSVRQLSPSL
jgi:Na+/H+-dicarboxylate symporter